MEYVSYKKFGAVGDGKTNDAAAIFAAHKYANEHGLPVRSEEGAVFYISDVDERIVIKTDTDWTGSSFIFDDREFADPDVRKIKTAVFSSSRRLSRNMLLKDLHRRRSSIISWILRSASRL